MLLPPFAEEMNKTRRMCAQLARGLASDGWRVVRLDLFGCGDSAGELRDATWTIWLDDLRRELALHRAQPGPLWLWAVRSGSLFADELLSEHLSAHLLLWQPVLSGGLFLQQFLRLRTASRMLASASAPADEPSPAQSWERGDVVEVAGYELPADIARGLQSSLLRLPTAGTGKVAWFELAARAESGIAPATKRVVDALRESGREVDVQLVAGSAFWQSTETVENEVLLQASIAALRGERTAALVQVRHAA